MRVKNTTRCERGSAEYPGVWTGRVAHRLDSRWPAGMPATIVADLAWRRQCGRDAATRAVKPLYTFLSLVSHARG
jgi:hypothetical protein